MDDNQNEVTPKAFISYTHDSDKHKEKVLGLADILNEKGVDCGLDQYEEAPANGWARWMLDSIKNADYVIVVCTKPYKARSEQQEEKGKGKGAKWEGMSITSDIYENDSINTKYIPIVLNKSDKLYIPDFLISTTHYDLSEKDGFENLYRRLTNQKKISKPKVGEIEKLGIHDPNAKSFGFDKNKIENFIDLCKFIYPILSENNKFFQSLGPNSGVDALGEVRWEMSLWHAARLDIIIPNNKKIVKAIEDYRGMIVLEHVKSFNDFTIHAYAFEAHVRSSSVSYKNKQFPKEFSRIVIKTCVASNQNNLFIFDIEKRIKDLMCNIHGLRRVILTGSVLSVAELSSDIDVFILVDEISDCLVEDFRKLSYAVLREFHRELHLSVFSRDELGKFEAALVRTEFFNEIN